MTLRTTLRIPLLLLALMTIGCGGPSEVNNCGGSGFAGSGTDFSSNTRRAADVMTSSFWDIQAFKEPPKSEVSDETVEKTPAGEVVVREVKYEVPASGGGKIRVFAHYAYPAAKKGTKLPAIVWVHGGGSIADRGAVIHWASLGYAAIGMDLPGKGGEAREKSRSEGPDMSDPLIFKVTPSPRESYLYLCVNSVCRAISFMRDQKEVDPLRIGVLGYSWGGVITLLANGIDDRIAAACTVYGAGFIHEESFWSGGEFARLSERDKRTWRERFDPSSYLKSQHGKTLFVGATQDIYYPFRSFIRTYQGAECPKSLYVALNKNHELDDAGAETIRRWFDWTLRSGPPLPSVRVKQTKDSFEVSAKGAPVVNVTLATAEPSDYIKAEWKSSNAKSEGGVWKVSPPKSGVASIVIAKDDSGVTVAEPVNVPVPSKAKANK